MATYDYTLSDLGALPLYNDQLMITINAIIGLCYDVQTEDEIIHVIFGKVLTEQEVLSLDNIIANYAPVEEPVVVQADEFLINNAYNNFAQYSSSYFVPANNKTVLRGWTLNVGEMDGMNNGVYTFSGSGIYLWRLQVTAEPSNNTEIHITAQNHLNSYLYGSTNLLDSSYSPINTNIGGGSLHLDGSSIKFSAEVKHDVTLSLELRIIKIMSI